MIATSKGKEKDITKDNKLYALSKILDGIVSGKKGVIYLSIEQCQGICQDLNMSPEMFHSFVFVYCSERDFNFEVAKEGERKC